MARRIALIVGISDYSDYPPLPRSIRDAETMAHVLKNVAEFDDVKVLYNPELSRLSEQVEEHFTDKAPDDLVLFYFSGHGVKDERGCLHLAVRGTRRHPGGELVRASAVSAQHVHEAMNSSRSRRQVVILDCCFSGAFAEGVQAKDGGRIDLRGQLGGEGRAILTSSSSTQYSFDAGQMGLSAYTQFLVQGIATGDADLNHDGKITVDELHEYARSQVQAAHPAMSPQILPSREGYSIVISKAVRADPRLAYAAKVREVVDPSGKIPAIGAEVLNIQRRQLGLHDHEAQHIQAEQLRPIAERAQARAILRRAVFEARRKRYLDAERSLLNQLRVSLDLGENDMQQLLSEPLELQRRKVRGWMYWPERALALSAGLACLALVGWGYSTWSTPVRDTPTANFPFPKKTPPTAEESAQTAPAPEVHKVGDEAFEATLQADHSQTQWAIRISADNTLEEAKDVVHEVLRESRFQPWIVRETFSPYRYFVFVGGYSGKGPADADRPAARSIVDPPGAISTYIPGECPQLTHNPAGYHDCQRSF